MALPQLLWKVVRISRCFFVLSSAVFSKVSGKITVNTFSHFGISPRNNAPRRKNQYASAWNW